MSHQPHPRILRSLLYTLLILCIITFCYKYQFTFPASPNLPIDEHRSTPIYEHISPYRQHANRTQEEVLEKKLIKIEESIISALQELEKGTRARKVIWQITSELEAPSWEEWTQRWAAINPEWEIKQYASSSPGPDILPYFRSIPLIAETLSAHPELEIDLFRWLLLWYHGGFYLEPDIWPRVAIGECFDLDIIEHPSLGLPRSYPNSTGRYVEQRERSSPISLVLGIDIDEPYMASHVREKWGWSRTFGFATYAMWAPGRFDPLLRKAIVRCISHSSTGLFGEKIDAKESGEVCGGAMLTDIVLEMLSENLKDVHRVRDMDAGLERRVTWKKFRSLGNPYWFSAKDFKDGRDVRRDLRGLGVLPINVWGSGQRHSGSERFDHEDACINHVYGRRPSVSLWQKLFG
ncbi:hypothetical protein SS1G_12086 [Sclerotinia sclerotiorum 1980 UF-70]|uniref:Initiation-specific alpha-1,6-mannosyltransferase n=2 Tax=Sclerotinia sclerotiorum (strain ATCC 18683 / 1980 / Ss-1) TaxID=665079 RepID=A7F2D9_SCLS1|nr:hypothetical protein SS1G_12086 [Sclerotinia sclerotiorum 1980 UF-70]APA09301.1 hypothetical protein sscle_05g040710 [Sclerotinia sclerotiorum 1980 UF-70]EDN95881.1 hypothetical protein SS1G_12086 [Sclerotinia sclerotiorum 1980 UF-70]